MRVDGVLARRPREHREVAVLRGDQRQRVALIVDELRRRQVARAAEPGRMDGFRHAADTRLGDDDVYMQSGQ